jgi:hypothetical protein
MRDLIYQLNEDEWAYIEAKAQERNSIKVVGTSKRFDPRKTDLRIHTYGMASEYAFAKLTGLTANLDAKKKGDDGFDFKLDNGLTIETRYRFERKRDFALNTDSLNDFTADIGVLIWPGSLPRSFEIVGWTTRVHFALQCERHRLRGWRLLIPWEKMRDARELTSLINNLSTIAH